MLFIIAIAALMADQLSKRAVEATLGFGEVMEIPGAAFIILQNANTFIILVAIVVGALIVYYALRLPA